MHGGNINDVLDYRIDKIMKEWHQVRYDALSQLVSHLFFTRNFFVSSMQNSDLLFAVHPLDGSLLVWVADFLDEYMPGSFRQAQVSFSSRIPNALPLGDAMTMGSNVELFNSVNVLNLRELFRDCGKQEEICDPPDKPETGKEAIKGEDEEEDIEDKNNPRDGQDQTSKNESAAAKGKGKQGNQKYKPPPTLSLITKHNNGTLNLWDVMFAEKSKFSQLLNIAHNARVSGHRFRVNAITAHPVLPLVLTTSHHNASDNQDCGNCQEAYFCSELILWRVDPVGPLSKNGGVTELARINSKEVSAFSDVAWIPTLLPR